VALLGANGAGKTTTLRTIMGVLKPMRGRVLFAGDDLAGKTADARARQGVAHVTESRGVFTASPSPSTSGSSTAVSGLTPLPRTVTSGRSPRWPAAGSDCSPAASSRCSRSPGARQAAQAADR
jgi:energy-coupling factor transporter ATP-binding protein EcfA2